MKRAFTLDYMGRGEELVFLIIKTEIEFVKYYVDRWRGECYIEPDN